MSWRRHSNAKPLSHRARWRQYNPVAWADAVARVTLSSHFALFHTDE